MATKPSSDFVSCLSSSHVQAEAKMIGLTSTVPCHQGNIILQPPVIKIRSQNLSVEEQIAPPKQYWFEWPIRHWGAKWNAYDIPFDFEPCCYHFFTAWPTPTPVIAEPASLFPELTITHRHDEPNMGVSGVDNYAVAK